jgi:hypothetical protein
MIPTPIWSLGLTAGFRITSGAGGAACCDATPWGITAAAAVAPRARPSKRRRDISLLIAASSMAFVIRIRADIGARPD